MHCFSDEYLADELLNRSPHGLLFLCPNLPEPKKSLCSRKMDGYLVYLLMLTYCNSEIDRKVTKKISNMQVIR